MKLEEKVVELLKQKNLIFTCAESCTGGLIAKRITDVSGSSSVFECGIVSYSNRIKHEILGVSNETLEKFGAVSEECAREMVKGVLSLTGADIAVAVTGIAGPTGATETKPVGLMYVGITNRYKSVVQEFKLNPKFDRIRMKQEFTQCALQMLLDALSEG